MRVRVLLCLLPFATLLAGCNLSDPVTGMPQVDDDGVCQSSSDCGVHGTCNEGVCRCRTGYAGDVCDRCAPGFYDDSATCLPEDGCVGTVVGGACVVEPEDCRDEEVPSTDGQSCVPDLCLDRDCTADGQVPGSCTMTSDTESTCECVEGFTGADCDLPVPCDAAPCGEHGTCTEDGDGGFTCACDARFAGDVCDSCLPPFANFAAQCLECEPGLHGPDCTLTCAMTEADPWWDPAWAERIVVIVTNPDPQVAPEGATISFTFDHASFATPGVDVSGNDVRVVAVLPDGVQSEIPRILGVDSSWNASDTQLWWASQRDLNPGEADVYHVYLRNSFPSRPPTSAPAVLPPSRGWARTNTDQILYSASRIPAAPANTPSTSVQVRQIDYETFEIFTADESDDGGAIASVEVSDADGNLIYGTGTIGDLTGTVGAPVTRLDTFESQSSTLVVRSTINDSNNSRYIFGSTLERAGIEQGSVTLTFTRSAPVGPDPVTAQTCPVQTRP